jgi:hypothetical protein
MVGEMKLKVTYNGITYHLTNSGLKVGDEVFPISEGHIDEDNKYVHTGIWLTEYFDGSLMSGLPDDPHIIEDLHHSDDKAYEVRTQKGFGPIEEYFKIIGQ